jgi:hypothetical protein
MSSSGFTIRTGHQLTKGLLIMLSQCPKEISSLVEAVIIELEIRMRYIPVNIINEDLK